MREEPSQLIYHDKSFQRITLSIGGPEASCLVCRYKCLLWRRGGWFGQRPEAFNVPFAQQEAQTNTWQRVTALWPWLELSDHCTRKYCIPCLHPGPEITTQKGGPPTSREKNYSWHLLSLWGSTSVCGLYTTSLRTQGKNVFSHGLSRPWMSSQRAPHSLTPEFILTFFDILMESCHSYSEHTVNSGPVSHFFLYSWCRHSDWLKEGSVTDEWMQKQSIRAPLMLCSSVFPFHITSARRRWCGRVVQNSVLH